MSSRIFNFLEDCTLIFPLHHHVLHTFSATLPNCKHLIFQGAPLNILSHISAEKLTHFSVICSGSFNRQGAQQLVRLSQAFRESRLVPNILHIGIEATSRAWMYALVLMPGLEELVIRSARPSSLGEKVFQSLVVTSTPAKSATSLCPSLQRFGLKYDRWLRSSEQFDMTLVFASIIRSRQCLKPSLKSFCLQMGHDQKDLLQLVGTSGVDPKGFIHLVKESRIEQNSLQFTDEELIHGSITANDSDSEIELI